MDTIALQRLFYKSPLLNVGKCLINKFFYMEMLLPYQIKNLIFVYYKYIKTTYL